MNQRETCLFNLALNIYRWDFRDSILYTWKKGGYPSEVLSTKHFVFSGPGRIHLYTKTQYEMLPDPVGDHVERTYYVERILTDLPSWSCTAFSGLENRHSCMPTYLPSCYHISTTNTVSQILWRRQGER